MREDPSHSPGGGKLLACDSVPIGGCTWICQRPGGDAQRFPGDLRRGVSPRHVPLPTPCGQRWILRYPQASHTWQMPGNDYTLGDL